MRSSGSFYEYLMQFSRKSGILKRYEIWGGEQMNFKSKKIIDEYRETKGEYIQLKYAVMESLQQKLEENGIPLLAIDNRIKTEESLAEKVERKGDKYRSLSDITDILGIRIICFFSDDVDRVASMIEEMYEMDWDNTIDKRISISPTVFGYLSLHYICSIPFNSKYPKEICGKKFEIQIRSTLQHVWAEIEHDLGYKSDFGVPRDIRREFSRVAGLLEIADERFASIRDSVKKYGTEIRQRIADNTADDLLVDRVTLKEYILLNRKMREFLERLASICGSQISEFDPEAYLPQLEWLGKNTIGDMQSMLEANQQLAYHLANLSLKNTDLDILSSNVGLRFLCRAELLLKKYPLEKIEEFMNLSMKDNERAARQAKKLMADYAAIRGGVTDDQI